MQALSDLRRLGTLLATERAPLARAGALSLVVAALGLSVPWFARTLFDSVYPSGNVSLLGLVVLGMLCAQAGEGAVRALGRFQAFAARTRMRDVMRLGLFNHVMHLPARVLERRRSGEIANRFTDARDVLDDGADALLTVTHQSVYLVCVPPLLFLLDARLALVAVISVPVTAIVTAALGSVANRHWATTYDAYDQWSAFRTEAVREARTMKAMGLERALYRRARAFVARAHAGAVRATALWYLCTGTNAVVRALNLAALAYLGWRAVIAGAMTLGDFVAFTAYAGLLLGPIAALVEAGGTVQRAGVSLRRVWDLVDEPTESDPDAAFTDGDQATTATPTSPRMTGRLRGAALTFRYDAETPCLDLDQLHLAPGESVALVGPSGCGKSTLLRLLARIETPDGGELSAEVTGHAGSLVWRPAKGVPLSAWRAQTAVCWQEPGLLSTSIADNLTLATEDVARRAPTEAEMTAALTDCELGPHLREMAGTSPLSAAFAAPLGEGAASLSAGERQRLALARTLLRVRLARPPIRLVLLDEAAANLDPATAHVVLARVLSEMTSAGAVVVHVTHRPEHAALAHRTLTLGSRASALSGDGHARSAAPAAALP